ncbi:MAG: transcription elongation factor subunit Spt4 [Candidatus Aenigmatarchaeota archaeon]
MVEKACRVCRRIVKGSMCPMCKSTDLTKSWRGSLIIINADSDIAREAGITAPGRYAVRVK